MVDACRKILLMDAHARRGLLVAQCLEIDFWETVLEPTQVAKAVMLQMRMLHPTLYKLEQCCVPRSILVEVDDYLPSPEKQKGQ